ncbi:MAG: hypothetical protein ABJB98_00725 [Actinomycetota bacterium]
MSATQQPASVTGRQVVEPPVTVQLAAEEKDGRSDRKAAAWASWLIAPALYLIAAIILYSRFLAHPNRGVPGGADGLLYAWYFEHIEQSIIHLSNPFFTTALNAPDGVNIMWNTSVFAVGVLLAPLTATIGPVATTNVALTLAPVLSATTAFYALRRLTGTVWGAALGAALYGFGPYFQGQAGHLHMIVAFFPPLLLLIGHEWLVSQHRTPVRTGIKLGVLTGLALLASEEIVALSAVLAVFAVLFLAALFPGEVAPRIRYASHALGVGLATAVALAGIPLGYQFFGPQALPGGVLPSSQKLDLAGLVRPGELQRFASAADIAANRAFPANVVENTGYLGWPLLALVFGIIGWLLARGERFALWWFLTFAITVVFALGPKIEINGADAGWGPWAVMRSLPLMDGAVAVRFTLCTTLLVALLLAWALARVAGAALVAGVAAAGVAFVPLLPADRYDAMLILKTPRFFTTSAVDVIEPGSAVVLLPRGGSPDVQAAGMLWQMRTDLRFKIIGGYSVINDHGQMTYIAPDPPFAQVLQQVGDSGVQASQPVLGGARASIGASGVRYIVITDQQLNAGLVAEAAHRMTGCVIRPVADVQLCTIPPTA